MSFTVDGVDLADGATAGAARELRRQRGVPDARRSRAAPSTTAKASARPSSTPPAARNSRSTCAPYRDGVAFRFIVPGGSDKAACRTRRRRSCSRRRDRLVAQPARALRGHVQQRDVGALEAGTWHAPPVTFKLPGGAYGAITEANLVNYSGMAPRGRRQPRVEGRLRAPPARLAPVRAALHEGRHRPVVASRRR